MRSDHLQHLLIALSVQLLTWAVLALLGQSYGDLHGAALAIALFYGREHRDRQIWLCAKLHCNLATLPWTQYLPWTWKRDGRWDFFCPVVGVLTVCLWRIVMLVA